MPNIQRKKSRPGGKKAKAEKSYKKAKAQGRLQRGKKKGYVSSYLNLSTDKSGKYGVDY